MLQLPPFFHLQRSLLLQPSGSGLEHPGRVKWGIRARGLKDGDQGGGSLPILYLFCGYTDN